MGVSVRVRKRVRGRGRVAARHHHGLEVEDDVSEGSELGVEIDQPRALALARRQVGAELHLLVGVAELAAQLAEQRRLTLAQLEGALEAEEDALGGRRLGHVSEVVEEERARGGEVRLEQLAPLALALEVTQLDGEGLARPVGHARVVKRERGGRVTRHHA